MKILNRKGFSFVEYLLLLVIILTAMIVLRGNIQRAIYGGWQQAGQSFAFGRQYDSQRSIECAYDDIQNLWYDRNCFEQSIQNCTINNATCYEASGVTPCSMSGSDCDQVRNYISQ